MIQYEFSKSWTETQKKALLKSSIFTQWLHKASKNFTIKKIVFQSFDFRTHSEEALFIKLKAEAYLKTGELVHGIVVLRGDAVAVLVVLRSENKAYLLMVEQPRFPIASTRSLEIPAGILDKSMQHEKIALEELKEEAQIEVHKDELINLTAFWQGEVATGFACSCGLLDEHIYFYAVEREVSPEELQQLDQKNQVYQEEGEWIKTVVMPYEEAAKCFVDGKNLIALFLYERWLKAQGRKLN